MIQIVKSVSVIFAVIASQKGVAISS